MEDDMKTLILSALVAGAAFAATSPADAAQGCGPGGHRGYYGHCRPNGPPVVVGPGPMVVGTYYPRQGWWDGHRYWQHRERWHGGWRYR
jgi:hypothetical protein